ncbi:MAG TPA: hypothetical protein VI094_08720 [Propionibacteriaceae bacterium]
MDESAQAYANEVQVLRLVFTVRQGRVELSDVHQVEMRVPPSASLEERTGVSGAWVEIRDADGAPIFRHDLSPSLLDSAELFPEDPYGEIIRVPTMPGTSAFSVLAPLPAEADTLVLVGGPTANARGAARELTEVDAQELRRRARG